MYVHLLLLCPRYISGGGNVRLPFFFFLSTIFRRRPICIRSSLSIRYIRSDRVQSCVREQTGGLTPRHRDIYIYIFFHFSKKGILHNHLAFLRRKENAKVEYLLSLLHSTDYSVSPYKQNSKYNITNVPDFRYIMRQRISSAADEMPKRLHILKTGRREKKTDPTLLMTARGIFLVLYMICLCRFFLII